MGKVFGILLIVVAIWLGLQYYAGESTPQPEPARTVSLPKQVGQRVTDSLAEGTQRTEQLAPDAD